MKDGLNYFALLLVAILAIKVSAFHIYEEHDPLEDPGGHCELCLIAIDGLQLEGIHPSPVVVPNSHAGILFRPVHIFMPQAHTPGSEAGQLFSRPPPTGGA